MSFRKHCSMCSTNCLGMIKRSIGLCIPLYTDSPINLLKICGHLRRRTVKSVLPIVVWGGGGIEREIKAKFYFHLKKIFFSVPPRMSVVLSRSTFCRAKRAIKPVQGCTGLITAPKNRTTLQSSTDGGGSK